jgi:hypothetical protein
VAGCLWFDCIATTPPCIAFASSHTYCAPPSPSTTPTHPHTHHHHHHHTHTHAHKHTTASPSAASGSSGGGGGSSTPVMTFGQRADAVLGGFSSRLQQAPIAMPQMCVAAWLKSKTPLRQVRLRGVCVCVCVCVCACVCVRARVGCVRVCRNACALAWCLSARAEGVVCT